MTDTFALSLYFFTITIIITIYTIEKLFPTRNSKTRSGIDLYTQKPYIHSPTPEPEPEPDTQQITSKQLSTIIQNHESYGITFSTRNITELTKLKTIDEVNNYIDQNVIGKR